MVEALKPCIAEKQNKFYMSMEYRLRDVEGLCVTTGPIDDNPTTKDEMKALIVKTVVQATIAGKNCRRLIIEKLPNANLQLP